MRCRTFVLLNAWVRGGWEWEGGEEEEEWEVEEEEGRGQFWSYPSKIARKLAREVFDMSKDAF